MGYKGFAICNICQAKVSRGGFWDNSSMKAYLRLTQVYIIHDVPVFFPKWIFQVPIKTPKFGTLKVIKYG